MRISKILSLVFLAFFLTILDTSFFSSFEIYGATLLSSLIVLTFFAIFDTKENYLVLAFTFIISFSIFSSLPIWIIGIVFLLLPLGLNYIRRGYFPKPTAFSVIIYLIAATAFFDFVLMVYSREWNQAGFLSLSYFVFINSFFGFLLFAIFDKVSGNLLPDIRVKL